MIDKYTQFILLCMILIVAVFAYMLIDQQTDKNLIATDFEVAEITVAKLLEIDDESSYREIISKLGRTKDVGSGVHVAQYIVSNSYIFLSFVDIDETCHLSGEELLENAQPIYINKVNIRGNVTSLDEGDDSITMLVEGVITNDTDYDKASIYVNDETEVTNLDGDVLNYKSIRLNDEVEVTFTGPVAESYPVQATAKKVIILGSSVEGGEGNDGN